MESECGRAQAYLSILCNSSPNRRTGSQGNRAATEFFAARVKELGYEVDETPFDCIDYERSSVSLLGGGVRHQVYGSPFSLGVNVTAPLAIATTVEELERSHCQGKILLLKGAIASEQLMPKNFVFYNPEAHRRIYALLEQKIPMAIITATTKNPSVAGAVYPFPMIEDGDFDIPSVYCTDATGEAIAIASMALFRLTIDARRIPSTASNVIASKNPNAEGKIVICAHIDTKENTPGALDNASGITVLLLLAEMLRDYSGPSGIEIVAINGEDHYSAGGEMDYLKRYSRGIKDIRLAVNIDDAGYKVGKTAFSTYNVPPELETTVKAFFGKFDGLVPGDQWYQGDHMMFVQAGRPALAVISEKGQELMACITHTTADTPEIVDCRKLVEISAALNSLIRAV